MLFCDWLYCEKPEDDLDFDEEEDDSLDDLMDDNEPDDDDE